MKNLINIANAINDFPLKIYEKLLNELYNRGEIYVNDKKIIRNIKNN